MTTLQERLGEFEDRLLSLTRRQYILEAFVKELDTVTRIKDSRFWSRSVWLMVLDFRDMNVIHLASWAKAVYQPSGLLGQIDANGHRKELRRKRKVSAKEKAERDTHYTAILDKYHQEAFYRLFPTATGDQPSGDDMNELKTSFKARMDPVLLDRSENRAHPYEKEGAGNAKMLDFPEVRALVDYAESFMNDLRLVSSGATLAYGDMNDTSSKAFARDLVDILLLGPDFRRETVRGDRPREAFYDELHARHDELDEATKARLLWNDNFPEDLGEGPGDPP